MGKTDLLLYAPCPVKLVVKEQIEAIAAAATPPLTAHIPMGCTSVDPYDPLYMESDANKLPAVIASIGYGDFWRGEFVRRFVNTGIFESVQPRVLNPLYADAGLIDPAGAYTIYGVTPYIFLVDHKELDGLPAPKNWADLMAPLTSTTSPGRALWPEGEGEANTCPMPVVLMKILSQAPRGTTLVSPVTMLTPASRAAAPMPPILWKLWSMVVTEPRRADGRLPLTVPHRSALRFF